MQELAPIVLFVYNRPWHTRQTIESLKQNELAARSDLFIFSDGGKSESDSQKVDEVRAYIKSIKGFGSVEVKEREKNYGLANSIISGVNHVSTLYDRIIVIEDDVITALSFLTFMNNALEFYQVNKSIFSVSGYTYPIKIPGSYKKEVFASYRASSWGWGTWKDRWEKVDWEVKDFNNFIKDKKAQKSFNRAGEDVTPMLKAQIWGEIDSWAIRWSYSHFRHNAYCLLPVQPLCKNIGTDSSGTHSATSKKFNVLINNNRNTIKLTNDLMIDDNIILRISKMAKPSLFRRIVNKLKDYYR
jgi:hypothetical protein